MAYPQVPQAPTGGLDPRLFRQQAQGMAAQDELRGMRNSLAEQQAYAQANTPMRGVTGSGYSASGPTLFDAFATMAQRNTGNKNIQAMKDQAAALRGDVTQGRMAEMEAAQAQKMQNFEQNRLMAQEARDDAANNMRGNMQVWANDEGNTVEFAMTANGPVDSRNNPVDLGGFGPPEKKGMGQYGIGGLGVKDRSNAAKAFTTIKKIENIKDIAKDFTQDDVDSMNKAGLNTAIKTLTPTAFENYVQNNWKSLSPRAKTLWTKMSSLGAEQRHALFGAALTKQEGALSEGFIVGANGLNFGDGQRRLDNLFDDTAAQLHGYDTTMGTNFLEAPELVNYERYQDPQDEVVTQTNVLAEAPTDPAARLEYLRRKKAEAAGQAPQAQPAPQRAMSRRQRRRTQRENTEARNYQQGILDELEAQDRAAGLTKTLNRRRGPQNANR